MTARLTFRLVVVVIVAAALGLIVARLLLGPRAPVPPTLEQATLFPSPRPLPALELIDHDGQPLGEAYFKAGWSIVFFGFTQCPDICPATLALLAQTRRELADLPDARQPRVLLVSVDPERDTPDRLKAYVQFFDPAFRGATGPGAAVQQAADAFMVPFARVTLPDGGYTFDHGSGVFFVAPSNAIVAYSSPPLQADVLARDFRTMVQFVEGPQ